MVLETATPIKVVITLNSSDKSETRLNRSEARYRVTLTAAMNGEEDSDDKDLEALITDIANAYKKSISNIKASGSSKFIVEHCLEQNPSTRLPTAL